MKTNSNGKIVIKFRIVWLFISIILIGLIVLLTKNIVINSTKSSKEVVVAYEANQKSLDVLNIMIENTDINNKVINEQRDIEFETICEEDENLPKDEEKIIQEGKLGKKQVTVIQKYQNGELISEEIIEEIILEEAIKEIKYVGTSEFLSKYKVHIGENIYLLESEDLKEEPNENSSTICTIPRYLNVTLNETGDEWIKVTYKEKAGYIKVDNITSDSLNPLMKEKNRIATLKSNVDIEMDLSKPSGLTLSDFKTILSNNSNDVNKIFESNAECFYNIEQKYKINGVLIAAMGIHESAWGTSRIAVDKCNLFGYTAYDSDPYNSATTFETYASAIETVARDIATKYLYQTGTTISSGVIATGIYYNGVTVKSINIRYASDENWGEKVYSYIQYLYNKL